MKNVITVIVLLFGSLSFGSVRELGTACAADCRYSATNQRQVVVGETVFVVL